MEVDTPRSKRRRGPSPPVTSHHTEATGSFTVQAADEKVREEEEPVKTMDPEEVKRLGLDLWEIIKDAVNKNGRVLSEMFIRLPNKRQYADYYEVIKKPISLEQIKGNLEDGQYSTLQAVKEDFEQCFINAKKYNVRDSLVWKDAKSLHKLVKRQYAKMTGTEDEGHDAAEDPDATGHGSDNENKKKKGHGLYRMLKTRLQKLTEKTDDNGRVLATDFMELPNKKLWPDYYQIIAQPMAFEIIFKHIKRKEYPTAAEFAKDVELVFDNALQYNQDHSQIWEDAQQLRAYFSKLMSDLPEAFALPQYQSAGKIRVKRPMLTTGAETSTSSASATQSTPPVPTNTFTSTNSLAPAVTAPVPTVSQLSATPQLPYMPAQALPSAPAPAPTIAQQNTQMALQKPSATPKTTAPKLSAPKQQTPIHRPITPLAPIPTPPQPQLPPPSVSASVVPAPSASISPAPAILPAPTATHSLRSVVVSVEPSNRLLQLDVADGVKSWMMRFGRHEKILRILNVQFVNEENDLNNEVDPDGVHVDVVSMEVDQPPPKPVKRGRGRPPKVPKEPPPAKESEVKPPPPPQKKVIPPPVVHVRLNGIDVMAEAEGGGWLIKPSSGVLNTVEVGGQGVAYWKVYVQTAS